MKYLILFHCKGRMKRITSDIKVENFNKDIFILVLDISNYINMLLLPVFLIKNVFYIFISFFS